MSENKEHVKAPKVKKTINIEAHIEERLLEVCAYLGMTPHSYLIARLGEAVSRDYVQFKVGENMGSQNEFMKMVSQALTQDSDVK